ncbi:MAG: exonuclease SbcCD subunit D [Rubricoccaceae bacterium]
MPDSPARLLVSGDLHLGRYPSRVPPGLPELGGEAACRALVEAALAHRADALVLTGDVADAANKHFEAFGVLERALRRLDAAGVETLMVAGNHDHDVLAALADALASPRVRLLGRGQRWEAHTLYRDGRPLARVCGWSFAAQHVRDNPLDGFPDLPDDLPAVALLHADLDAPGSPYAPVALGALWNTPVCAWLLGHIHAPRLERQGARLALYPGSPLPLDPGETGPHGPWLVTLDRAGRAEAEPLALAPLRYATADVDVDGADAPEELRARVLAAVRAFADAARAEQPALRHLVLRLRLTGRTAAFGHLDHLEAELADGDALSRDGLAVYPDGVLRQAAPALDLEALADGSGPLATLAALALRLESGTLTPADEALVARTAEAVRDTRRHRAFEPLTREGRLEGDLRPEALARLRRQVLRMLDATAAQRA